MADGCSLKMNGPIFVSSSLPPAAPLLYDHHSPIRETLIKFFFFSFRILWHPGIGACMIMKSWTHSHIPHNPQGHPIPNTAWQKSDCSSKSPVPLFICFYVLYTPMHSNSQAFLNGDSGSPQSHLACEDICFSHSNTKPFSAKELFSPT